MVKFLKTTYLDAVIIIPAHDILTMEIGSTNDVKIYINKVGHRASLASEVLGYKFTAATANNTAKQKEQLAHLVNELEKALSTDWKKPMYELSFKYPVTGFNLIEDEWSNPA